MKTKNGNNNNFEKKLKAYSSMAAGVLAIANPARSQVVYTDVNPDLNYSISDTCFLNLNNDTTIDFIITQYTDGATYKVLCGSFSNDNEILVNGDNYPIALFSNNMVNATSSVNTWNNDDELIMNSMQGTSPYGLWQGGVTDRYLGLRILICDRWHYGWARLDVDSTAQSFTLKDYAYQDYPDAPMKTGATANAEASPATNVTVVDNSDSGNGWDMLISFNKANETTVSEYHIFVVKSANAASFNIEATKCIGEDNFTKVPKTGYNFSQTLNQTSRDIDGSLITENVAYKVFVLSLPDGSNATIPVLSAPSNEITLVYNAGVDENNLPGFIDIYSYGKNIHVNISKKNMEGYVAVYNTVGQEIYREALNKTDNIIPLDNSAQGVYLVRININGRMYAKKLILN